MRESGERGEAARENAKRTPAECGALLTAGPHYQRLPPENLTQEHNPSWNQESNVQPTEPPRCFSIYYFCNTVFYVFHIFRDKLICT